MTPEEAREAFPGLLETDGSFGYAGPGYEALIEKMPGEEVISTGDNDYQGSSYVLLRDGDRYGYLEYGWGSCSGCDADQACSSLQDVADLFNSLNESIQWFDSLPGFLGWAKAHDWKGNWSWGDGVGKFIRELNQRYGLELEEPKE